MNAEEIHTAAEIREDECVCVDLVSRGKGPFAERPDYRVPQLMPPPLDT